MLTFILNPKAGKGHVKKHIQQMENILNAHSAAYRMIWTEYSGHATAIARQAAGEAECTGVIAVGGDGTICEVACGLIGTEVPLGIIPMGTGNDFIKTIGLPKDPLSALDFILTHQPRPVDMGRLNDGFFLNDCGTGFDVTVLDCTMAAKKYCRGLLPYLIGLIRGIFRYRPVHIRMTVDDGSVQEKDVLVCSVANGRYIGGGIPICPEARPDDGMLDLVVVENRPRWMLPFYVPGLLTGKVLQFGITSHIRCQSVEVESEGMRLNVDGEIRSMEKAAFSVLPGALKLYW